MIPRQTPPPTKPEPVPPMRVSAGMRMGSNPLGFWMEGPAGGGADFRHPWTVYAGGAGARVSSGLILAEIAVEPVIGTVSIGGDDQHPQPVLKLDASLANDLGESWVCVEVTPDADGKLDPEGKKSKVEVVHRDHPIVAAGKTGCTPLAILVWKKGRPQVFQIAMFHFRYETSVPSTGPRKHFFL